MKPRSASLTDGTEMEHMIQFAPGASILSLRERMRVTFPGMSIGTDATTGIWTGIGSRRRGANGEFHRGVSHNGSLDNHRAGALDFFDGFTVM